MWRLILATATCALGIARVAIADATPAADLQQIVEKSTERFTKAFADRDAEAVAELFTEKGEYIDASGMIFHGRAAIEAEFAAAFEVNPAGTMTIRLVSIRPIAEGVLTEDGVTSFTPEAGGPVSQTRYTATHVKQGDESWLLASVRELDAGEMTHHDRLQALAWLLGAWHEDVADGTITTRWKWSDDGAFLVSDFSIRRSPDVTWTGTHRIGWDAERNRFRSWIFESNGGAVEGLWRMNDDGSWSVDLSGVDAEGVRRSSLLTYVPDGEDAIVISQQQRVVGGVSLPGSVHRAVRKPPAAKVSESQR